MEFGNSLVCVPTQQELRVGERIAAYNADDMDKVARIDEREGERQKWKAYHAVSVGIVQVYPKRYPQRVSNLLEEYLV